MKLPEIKAAADDTHIETVSGIEFEKLVYLRLKEDGLLEGGAKKQNYK